jgi:glycosyltransferase involved in cell wall biosynthesis
VGSYPAVKICILTTSFPRTKDDDAGVFVLRMVEALAGRGLEGLIVVPQDADETLWSVGTFSLKRFSYSLLMRRRLAFGAGIMPNIRRNPFALLQVPGLVFGYLRFLVRFGTEYDAVHAQWLITALPAWLAGMVTRRPFLVTARGEDLRLLTSPLIRILLAPALRRATRIIAVSESAKAEMLNRFPAIGGKVQVIENGVSCLWPTRAQVDRIREKCRVDPGVAIITFIGSIVPRKRIEIMLEMLSRSAISNVHLVLCGRTDDSSYLETCCAHAASLRVADQVHFIGSIASGDVSALLSISTLYVSASEFEGRPNAIVEALAHGVPVIASKIASHEELAQRTKGLRVFKDVEEGAAIVAELLRNQTALDEMARAGREFARDLSWEKCAELYERVYREAALNPTRTATTLPMT